MNIDRRPRKILVTGGVGYVGRELVSQLVSLGEDEIHILDNLICGEARLDQVNLSKAHLHRIDIRNAAAVGKLMDELLPDVVFHLAAIHYIPACEAAPGDAVSINVAGTVNLLAALSGKPRFVFASTAAVYRPSDAAHTENPENVSPVDIYGVTKLQGEEFVRYFHEREKVDAAIVRLFNVVGPGETNPHLVPAIIGQISRGERRVQLGNLFPQRDYIDVRDAAEGFRRLGAATGSSHPKTPLISNLGTGNSYAVGEIVRKIGQAAEVDLEIVQAPDRIRANDRPHLCASTKLLKYITGWSPARSIDDSLRSAWNSRQADGFS